MFADLHLMLTLMSAFQPFVSRSPLYTSGLVNPDLSLYITPTIPMTIGPLYGFFQVQTWASFSAFPLLSISICAS